MRLAVLADIHGNLPALEAVVAELARLQPDFVILNGDLINPVPFNNEVVEKVRSSGWAVVRGNHEFYLLDFGTERAPQGAEDAERWGSLHWLVRKVGAEQANYLAALPDELRLRFPGVQPIRAAHGVPGRNRVGFYQEMEAEKIVAAVGGIEEATVISAHTHVQVDRHLRKPETVDPMTDPMTDPHLGGRQARPRSGQLWHVINPGSVGLPLNGDPAAQFALLESVAENEEPGGWRALHRRVDYDRRPALEAFQSEGLLDAGGVIAQLFYWELVTARPEIISFFRWCWANGHDPDAADIRGSFAAYIEASGRARYVQERDPLRAGRAE